MKPPKRSRKGLSPQPRGYDGVPVAARYSAEEEEKIWALCVRYGRTRSWVFRTIVSDALGVKDTMPRFDAGGVVFRKKGRM